MIKPDKVFCGMLETNYNILTTNIDLILFLPLKSLNKLKSYIKRIENATFGRIQNELDYYENLMNQFLNLLDTKWNNATEDMCYSAWRCFVVRDLCYGKSWFGNKTFPAFEEDFNLFQKEVCGGKILDSIMDTVDKGFDYIQDGIDKIQIGFDNGVDKVISEMEEKYNNLLENTYINLSDISLKVYLSSDELDNLTDKLKTKRDNEKLTLQANQSYYATNYNETLAEYNETKTSNTAEIGLLTIAITYHSSGIIIKQAELDAKQYEIDDEYDPVRLLILNGELDFLENEMDVLVAEKSSFESDKVDLTLENEEIDLWITNTPSSKPTDQEIEDIYNLQEGKDLEEIVKNTPNTTDDIEMNIYDLLNELDKYSQCAIGSCDFAYSAMNFDIDTSEKMSMDSSREVSTTNLTESMNRKWDSLDRQMAKITNTIDKAYTIPKTIKKTDVMRDF